MPSVDHSFPVSACMNWFTMSCFIHSCPHCSYENCVDHLNMSTTTCPYYLFYGSLLECLDDTLYFTIAICLFCRYWGLQKHCQIRKTAVRAVVRKGRLEREEKGREKAGDRQGDWRGRKRDVRRLVTGRETGEGGKGTGEGW